MFGGFGTILQTPAQVSSNALTLTPSSWSLTQFTGLSFGDPIDMTKGHYLYAHNDITVGLGSFPHALSLQRMYSSGARLKGGPLGRGWSHNFNSSVGVGSAALREGWLLAAAANPASAGT